MKLGLYIAFFHLSQELLPGIYKKQLKTLSLVLGFTHNDAVLLLGGRQVLTIARIGPGLSAQTFL